MLLLLRRRDAAVSAGLRAGSSPQTIAGRIETAWRAGIQDLRSMSRLAGAARLRAELASMGVPYNVAKAASEEAVRDALRARKTAASYAKHWLSAAGENGAKEASKATAARARMIAATESSEAFNGGRLRALRNFPTISVMRVWDAVLDKATCPLCAGADGTLVGTKERFPIGEPGAVHPRCRCTWQLVTIEETK